MPTPVGHLLSGVLVYFAIVPARKVIWPLLLCTLFVASLPDIDFLFGYIVGNPNKYHHHFTHSISFAAVLGLVCALLGTRVFTPGFKALAALFITAALLHIVLDLLAVDTSFPRGAPIFWPFSDRYFIFPFHLFSDVERVSDSKVFFKSMLTIHNLRTVGIEIAILTPLTILTVVLSRRSKRR